MEASGSIENDLEMYQIGRHEGLTVVVVVVNKSSKLSLFDGNGQFVNENKQVGGNGVAFEKLREGPVNNNVVIEGFGEER